MSPEDKKLVQYLRKAGNTIMGIYHLTHFKLSDICEVIYEQNQDDISRDDAECE